MLTFSQHIEGLIKPNYPKAVVYDPVVDFNLNERLSQTGRVEFDLKYTVMGYDSFNGNLLTVGSMSVYQFETQRVHVPHFKYTATFITEVRCHMLRGKETEDMVQHLANLFRMRP